MIANKVEKFLQFVYHIVERPGMYGVNEIDDLYFITLGYQYSDLEGTSDISELLDGFRDFLNKRYKTNDNHDWPKLIKLYSGSDRHSIELFGRLLGEYLRKINSPFTFKGSDQKEL